MSKEEFEYNLHLLEEINGIEALVKADNFEYLCSDGNWKKISSLGISYIPIVLYTSCLINDDMKRISYKLNYELLVPHVRIPSKYTESIVICTSLDKDLPFEKIYTKDENPEYDAYFVRYNNENINTFSKVKSSAMMNQYKTKNRRKIYEVANILNESIKYHKDMANQKTLTIN